MTNFIEIAEKERKIADPSSLRRGFQIHLSGIVRPESRLSLNGRDNTLTLVNHSLKRVVLGANTPLSIAILDHGYKMVLFRMDGMMGALLVNNNNVGKLACTTFAGIHVESFTELTDSYEIYRAHQVTVKRLGRKLRGVIADAVRLHYERNGFWINNGYACSFEAVREFRELLEELEDR